MEVFKQGEDYEPEEEVKESEEKAPEGKFDFIKTVDKKILVGIAAAVVLLVAGVLYASTSLYAPAEDQTGISIDITASGVSEVSTFTYTDTELAELRAYGYTGAEIEEFQSQAIPSSNLVEDARAAQEAIQRDILETLSDVTSPEYQELLNSTWLGGEPLTITPTENYSTEIVSYNADYDKVEPKGTQLFLAIHLEDGTNVFMPVHPVRWVTLKDSGNINVEYTVVTYGSAKVVTEIHEVEVG